MNPIVSIIVPIYNAEDFLPRCVDSILAQEFRDFEVLLIDDGSSDGSPALCDGYAAQDDRVRAVHKPNSGVSDTRNLAISMARGDYLQFVDSDDWLAPNATGLLVHAAQGASCDMVIADFYRVVGDRLAQKGDIEETGVMNRETFAGHMMENPADFYYGVLWNKLYRREIIAAHDLTMDSDISWCEDFMFNLEYIRHAQSFVAIQVPIYYYLKRKGSLVSQGISISKTIKMKLTVFEVYNNFYKHILDEKDYEKSRLQVYRFLLDSAGDGMVLPAIFPGSKKLGEERMTICTDVLDKPGLLLDDYRRRKLLEFCMEPVSLKHSLTFTDLRVLFYLSRDLTDRSRKELADLIGVSRASLSLSAQKLAGRGYLRVEDVKTDLTPEEKAEKKAAKKAEKKADPDKPAEPKPPKKLHFTIPEAAQPILKDMDTARKQYEAYVFEGFSQEERELYSALNGKMKDNVRQVLDHTM